MGYVGLCVASFLTSVETKTNWEIRVILHDEMNKKKAIRRILADFALGKKVGE